MSTLISGEALQQHTRSLMEDVGFQRITTYGDFQDTYDQDQVDFLVHVAEKGYNSEAD